MAMHIHPLDLPPRFYKPLGQVAAGWNLTEALIQSAIWHVHNIKSPKIGRLFTYRASAIDKLRMFRVTFESFVPDRALRSEMKAIHKEADRLRGKRNTLMHGLWGRMPGRAKEWKVFYVKDTSDSFLLKRDAVSLPDLEALAGEVRALNVRLKKLLTRIGAPPP